MVTSPAATPARGASKATAAASARESAPPEQATNTGPPASARVRRTADRISATAGAGPVPVISAPVHPRDPISGRGDLSLGRQGLRRRPDGVEVLQPDASDNRPHER